MALTLTHSEIKGDRIALTYNGTFVGHSVRAGNYRWDAEAEDGVVITTGHKSSRLAGYSLVRSWEARNGRRIDA